MFGFSKKEKDREHILNVLVAERQTYGGRIWDESIGKVSWLGTLIDGVSSAPWEDGCPYQEDLLLWLSRLSKAKAETQDRIAALEEKVVELEKQVHMLEGRADITGFTCITREEDDKVLPLLSYRAGEFEKKLNEGQSTYKGQDLFYETSPAAYYYKTYVTSEEVITWVEKEQNEGRLT